MISKNELKRRLLNCGGISPDDEENDAVVALFDENDTIRDRVAELEKREAAFVVGRDAAMVDLCHEISRARSTFPGNDMLFEALAEEVGELARAMDGDGDIRAEAIQVACVAIRIATEGTTEPDRFVVLIAVDLERRARRAMAKKNEKEKVSFIDALTPGHPDFCVGLASQVLMGGMSNKNPGKDS